MERLVLDPYFIHSEQVLALLGSRADAALRDIDRRGAYLPSAPAYILANHLASALAELGIAELQRAVYEGSLAEAQPVGIEQAFYFRRAKARDREGDRPIDFSGKLNTDEAVTVVGTLNSERCPAASGAGNLSRRARVYVVGTVTDWDGATIRLRPVFAGTRTWVAETAGRGHEPDISRRVYPTQIDQFERVDFRERPSEVDFRLLRDVPESEVKAALAEIIGEPFVHKDWGGERSDLYTSRVFVDGKQASSAWLLKGPSFYRPMTIAALGKPGDQIDRLYSEPAEVLVLQHCHEIRAAVVNMMETYAHDARRPRRFMTLDGYDTSRILRTYGMLPAA